MKDVYTQIYQLKTNSASSKAMQHSTMPLATAINLCRSEVQNSIKIEYADINLSCKQKISTDNAHKRSS